MTEYQEKIKLNLEDVSKLNQTLNTPGWKEIINKWFDMCINKHIENLKINKKYDELMYSQAVLEVIEGLFDHIDAIQNQGKNNLDLIGKYKERRINRANVR